MFVVSGINHQSAPLALRESLAVPDAILADALSCLKSKPAVQEIMLLSTCHRTELYAEVSEPVALMSEFAAQQHIDPAQVLPHRYLHYDQDAMRHLLQVGCGLDSIIIGESQIFNQLKAAYQQAAQHHALGSKLRQRLPAAFSICKKVRHQTALTENPLSLTHTAVQLCQASVSDLSSATVVVIGAGEVSALLAKYLSDRGVGRLFIVNRHLAHATALASRVGAQAAPLSALSDYLMQADAVFSATASRQPIIDVALLEKVMLQREERPLFIADLAMPRDVSQAAAQMPGIDYHYLDSIETRVQENTQKRQAAKQAALGQIESHLMAFQRDWRVRQVSHVITGLRDLAMQQTKAVLESAKKQLGAGLDPELVLSGSLYQLTQKLLHQPTACLRQAAASDDTAALAWVQTHVEALTELSGCPFALKLSEGDDT